MRYQTTNSGFKLHCWFYLLATLFAFLISFPVILASHTIYHFQKSYGTSQIEDISRVSEIHGGFLLTGDYNTAPVVNPSKGLIVKTFLNGDINWVKKYTATGNLTLAESVESNDSGYVITGYLNYMPQRKILLMKTDSNGNVLWSKSYAESGDEYAFHLLRQTDGYLIYGFTGSAVFLLKTNLQGDVTWFRVYKSAVEDNPARVNPTRDGGFILLTQSSTGAPNVFQPCIIKTDHNGNLAWSKIYASSSIGNVGGQVSQTNDGGYIIASSSTAGISYSNNICVIKTDSVGDTLWTRIIGIPGEYYMVPITGQIDFNGHFVVFGYREFVPGQYKGLLFNIDMAGNIIWSKSSLSLYNEISFSKISSDSSFLLTGTSASSFSSGYNDFFMIKCDKDCNLGCYEENAPLISMNIPIVYSDASTFVTVATVTTTDILLNVTPAYFLTMTFCSDSTIIEDPLVDIDTSSLFVPNIITPNGDNLNDYFPGNKNKIELKIKIYNRWGELIYDNEGNSNGWNGRDKNGNLVNEGVYYYIINSLNPLSQSKEFHGYVYVK